jgi:acid phosphatase (class A)
MVPRLLLFLPALLALLAAPLPAQQFLPKDDTSLAALLPPPPDDASPAGLADLDTVLQWQRERTPEQVERATKVAGQSAFAIGAKVMGAWFTEENLPKTRAILKTAYDQAQPTVYAAKNKWNRPRPYQRDPRVQPAVQKLSNNPSYPSGHSADASVWAGVLAAAFPEKAEAFDIAVREAMWGRIAGGVHFPSDTEAGRILGQAIVKKMLESPDMQAALETIRAEAAPFYTKAK